MPNQPLYDSRTRRISWQTEDDYDAIRPARSCGECPVAGFLLEFARRNRSADIQVLLDVIERLELQMNGEQAQQGWR